MWIAGVRVIVFDDKDRVLLVRQRHEDRDIWMAPGGGVDEGETSVDAAVREMKEETHLDIKVKEMIWHIEEQSQKRGQRCVNYFFAEVVSGTLELGTDPEFDDEHQRLEELRYVSKEEMKELEVVFPSYLRDELWDIYENRNASWNAYKIRRKYK